MKLFLIYKILSEKRTKRRYQILHVSNPEYMLLTTNGKAGLMTLKSSVHFE